MVRHRIPVVGLYKFFAAIAYKTQFPKLGGQVKAPFHFTPFHQPPIAVNVAGCLPVDFRQYRLVIRSRHGLAETEELPKEGNK